MHAFDSIATDKWGYYSAFLMVFNHSESSFTLLHTLSSIEARPFRRPLCTNQETWRKDEFGKCCQEHSSKCTSQLFTIEIIDAERYQPTSTELDWIGIEQCSRYCKHSVWRQSRGSTTGYVVQTCNAFAAGWHAAPRLWQLLSTLNQILWCVYKTTIFLWYE